MNTDDKQQRQGCRQRLVNGVINIVTIVGTIAAIAFVGWLLNSSSYENDWEDPPYDETVEAELHEYEAQQFLEEKYNYEHWKNQSESGSETEIVEDTVPEVMYEDMTAVATERNGLPSERSGVTASNEGYTCSYCIKGNINYEGEHIYHFPGCEYYEKTRVNVDRGERWFSSEAEAKAAGWRRALNCP